MTLYKYQHPLSHRSFRFTCRLCPTVFLSNIRVHACFHNCSHWVTHNLPLQAPAPSILPGSIIKWSVDPAGMIQPPANKNYSDPIPLARKRTKRPGQFHSPAN